MITYSTLIIASWCAFLFVWIIFAFRVKPDIRGGGVATLWMRYFLLRFVVAALLLFVSLRIATGTAHYAKIDSAIFERGIFMPPLALGWLGAVLCAFGVGFAIWARLHLGRNWSPAPAVKEKHELVTSGPYRFVRHPIYTGVILATLGTALTGTLYGTCVFIIVSVLFLRRINKEEKIMLDLFPDEYPSYMARTKRLIPFVW